MLKNLVNEINNLKLEEVKTIAEELKELVANA